MTPIPYPPIYPDPPLLLVLYVHVGIGLVACALTHTILGRWPGIARVVVTACLGPLGLFGVALAVIQRRLETRSWTRMP